MGFDLLSELASSWALDLLFEPAAINQGHPVGNGNARPLGLVLQSSHVAGPDQSPYHGLRSRTADA